MGCKQEMYPSKKLIYLVENGHILLLGAFRPEEVLAKNVLNAGTLYGLLRSHVFQPTLLSRPVYNIIGPVFSPAVAAPLRCENYRKTNICAGIVWVGMGNQKAGSPRERLGWQWEFTISSGTGWVEPWERYLHGNRSVSLLP